MRKLFTIISLVCIISCNQNNSSAETDSNNSVDSSISDNKYIAGAWTMCAEGGNGTMITRNVCPRIILIGNGTGYVEMGSEIREHFIWTLKKSEFKIMYETKNTDRTFPHTTYYANFERENGRLNLTLTNDDYQYYLSK